jgi:hypothetical protein
MKHFGGLSVERTCIIQQKKGGGDAYKVSFSHFLSSLNWSFRYLLCDHVNIAKGIKQEKTGQSRSAE